MNKVTELSMSYVQWKSLAEAPEAVGEFIFKFGLNDIFQWYTSTGMSNKKAEKSAGPTISERTNAELSALLQTSQPLFF